MSEFTTDGQRAVVLCVDVRTPDRDRPAATGAFAKWLRVVIKYVVALGAKLDPEIVSCCLGEASDWQVELTEACGIERFFRVIGILVWYGFNHPHESIAEPFSEILYIRPL